VVSVKPDKGEKIMTKKKTLGDIIFMDKKGLGDLLDQAAKLTGEEIPWHNCNICGDPYMEAELIDDEDIGFICEVCAKSKKELDREQEEIEMMRREAKVEERLD